MYNFYYRSYRSILPVLYVERPTAISLKNIETCASLFSGRTHFQLVSLGMSGFTALHLSFFSLSSSVTQKKQKCEVLIRRIFRVYLKSELSDVPVSYLCEKAD